MKKLLPILLLTLVACGKEPMIDNCKIVFPGTFETVKFNGSDRDQNGVMWNVTYITGTIYCNDDPFGHCHDDFLAKMNTPNTRWIQGTILGEPTDTIEWDEKYGLRCP